MELSTSAPTRHASDATPGETGPRRLWRRVSRVLAERSRRGRIASWILVGAALIVAGWIVWIFFPRPSPSVQLMLPGPAGAVAVADALHVWPNMQVLVKGTDARASTRVRLELNGMSVGRLSATDKGVFGGVFRIPPAQRPGAYSFVAVDEESHRRTHRQTLLVEDPARATLIAQPGTVAAGGDVALVGGGFRPRVLVVLKLDEGRRPPRVLRRVRTKGNGLVIAAAVVPGDTSAGARQIVVIGPDGQAAGTPATVQVTR